MILMFFNTLSCGWVLRRMTEEVINGNTWPPDTRAMGVISRAAFEVDDFWRIVQIVRKRFKLF